MNLSKLLKNLIVSSFLLSVVLTGCEKDDELTITAKNYLHSKIQAGGPSRIDQTPVRLNTKASVSISIEHETKKGIIGNIR